MEKKATIVMLLRICFAASAILKESSVDESSLLSMKAYINSDILAANWSKETSFCTWTGIICGRKLPERVTAINLSNMGLGGTIANEIGNLSSLRFVDISNNSFNGLIPNEIGLLRKVQGLNLSNNYTVLRVITTHHPQRIFGISTIFEVGRVAESTPPLSVGLG